MTTLGFTAQCIGGPRHGEEWCQPTAAPWKVVEMPHPDCRLYHPQRRFGFYFFDSDYVPDRNIWRWGGWSP